MEYQMFYLDGIATKPLYIEGGYSADVGFMNKEQFDNYLKEKSDMGSLLDEQYRN